MGNGEAKLNFRKAVIQLTTKTQILGQCVNIGNMDNELLQPLLQPPVEADDEAFWNQFWSECVTCVQDVFTLIPAAEIRALREESPSNLATLCYKAVEKLVQAAENGCITDREKQTVLNCVRLLSRVLPYIFEDPDWRGFFWSTLPGQASEDGENESPPLAQSLLNALSDLLFCPDFTVSSTKKQGPDSHEDIQTIDSCEYIWAAGVGFANTPAINATHDSNRTEILRLLLTCFSETMYLPPLADAHSGANQWISYFTSTENRHALPLFTSLLNIICSYDPVGYGVPYNHLMFSDFREPLVEIALQVLCVTLDNDPTVQSANQEAANTDSNDEDSPDGAGPDNLFLNYMSRIHREEDFSFILKGLPRLLNNPLAQTYLPGSCKKIQFHQELLVLFWKMCDINKKFMFYVLKSSDVLDILVPILYHLNDARADQSRVGLMHIGVFILLLLSGERNFGVRLNKPYTVRVPMDVPVFTGTHADFLIIVFHKIITTGHQRLQPLFDCLLTIIVNVSPYLKTLSMVASTKLLHLLEAFSTPWFLYAIPTNHHLVFFLLEVFNNIIQYQFDGNSNLIYTVIRKRNVFHQLANLATDHHSITKALSKRSGRKVMQHPAVTKESKDLSMEGSIPALEAEPGTLKATLAATPGIHSMSSVEAHSLPLADEGAIYPDQDVNVDLTDNTNSDPWLWRSDLLKSFTDTGGMQTTQPTAEYNVPKFNSMMDMDFLLYPPPKEHVSVSSSDPSTMSDTESADNTRHPSPVKMWAKLKKTVVVQKPSLFEIAKKALDNNNDEESELKSRVAVYLDLGLTKQHGIDKMTEMSPASAAHSDAQSGSSQPALATHSATESVQPGHIPAQVDHPTTPGTTATTSQSSYASSHDGALQGDKSALTDLAEKHKSSSTSSPPASPTESVSSQSQSSLQASLQRQMSTSSWVASPEWVASWKQKLPLQTIMRLLQVLVPQVEKICIDKGLTDESEILKFLQHGTLVGLLPVPHPILIRKYQANSGTTMWFRTYMWGVIYLRNVDPPVWYDTDVKLFEIQRV